MLRILSVDNLSGAPYRLETPDVDHSLRLETPARIHDLVACGHFDAALLPVGSLPFLGESTLPLGAYGIACRGAVRSVQLFSELPLEKILHEGLPIYGTPKSRTSIALLRVLCEQLHGIAPVLTTSYPRAAAHLLIGDAAFEYAQRRPVDGYDLDLSEGWYALTGLPFVFARWVPSPSLDRRSHARLSTWLEACASRAESPEGIAHLASLDPESDLIAARTCYYQQLRTRLDGDSLAGLNLFLELIESTRHEYSTRIA